MSKRRAYTTTQINRDRAAFTRAMYDADVKRQEATEIALGALLEIRTMAQQRRRRATIRMPNGRTLQDWVSSKLYEALTGATE